MKRKALGKGLSALLPGSDETSPPEALTTTEVPVATLDPNPFQPRSTMAPERLAELTESIRVSGIVQPILVRRLGERFQIVAGERRFRAAQQLGLTTVPVVVRDVPEEHLLELALIENIQREELSALEEAHAFQRLQEEFKLSQEEVARRVGRDRSTIANTVRLLRLARPVRDLLAGGSLQAGHARALLALDRGEDQVSLAREAARRGLSVREVERRVALIRAPGHRSASPRRDPNTGAAEERLRAALGTRVQISRRGKGGFVRMAFGSEAELQRLYDLILRGAKGRAS
jgi:ParB family transcriptional regulator, chromosome partitioning protein